MLDYSMLDMMQTSPAHINILFLQEALQDHVGALQQQLTWLQSHADLQDKVNQDLLAEVMHLRNAYAASISPN